MLVFQGLLTLVLFFSTIISLIMILVEDKFETRIKYLWIFILSAANFINLVLTWCGVK